MPIWSHSIQYFKCKATKFTAKAIKLKSAIKNETEIFLRLSSNITDNSGNKTSFPHWLLLTYRQVANLSKPFASNSSTDIKLSKSQLSKMI